jgi:hypothetical protein
MPKLLDGFEFGQDGPPETQLATIANAIDAALRIALPVTDHTWMFQAEDFDDVWTEGHPFSISTLNESRCSVLTVGQVETGQKFYRISFTVGLQFHPAVCECTVEVHDMRSAFAAARHMADVFQSFQGLVKGMGL